MVSIFITGLICALIIWVLAQPFMSFIPFLNVSLNGIWAILLVALVLGLVCAFIVPAVKKYFKKANAIIYFIAALVINALALILSSYIVNIFIPGGFGIDFISALIVAAILSLVVVGFSLKK